MKTTHDHIGAEILAGIAAGDGSLESRYRQHLAACAACSSEVERIKAGLARFSDLAREHAPSTRRRIVLNSGTTAHHFRPWAWGAGLATATAMAAAVLMVLWLGPEPTELSFDRDTFIVQQQMADSSLLKDVDDMVENPLPLVAFELSEDGAVSGTDEEFLDFIVPPVLDGARGAQEEWIV